MLNEATNSSEHIYMLAGSCMRHHEQISKWSDTGDQKSLILERSGTQYGAMVTKL